MNKIKGSKTIFLFSLLLLLPVSVTTGQPLLENHSGSTHHELAKIPGVTGFGQDAVGGKGGRVIAVTNLNRDGEGSLAAAIEAEGPRIIVFEVAGVIDLNRRNLTIRNPYITIAGQSAPPPGITLIKGQLGITTHEVIVQHIRVRPGEAGHAKKSGWEPDGIATSGGAWNVIIDHCTTTWATDENLSASGPRFEGNGVEEWRKNTSHRVTISNNIIAQGLSNSTHAKGEHSKGTLIHDNATDILIYGNLYADNMDRHPLAKGGTQTAIVNNYMFNPGRWLIHYNQGAGWENYELVTGKMTVEGNYIEYGPSTDDRIVAGRFRGPVEVYWEDNIIDTHMNTRLFDASSETKFHTDHRPVWPEGLVPLPAEEVKERVLQNAGAFPWARDDIDAKIVADARAGIGKIIDSETEAGGYPVVAPVRMPVWIDQNRNHIPDWWEEQQGLDLNNPENTYTDSNGNGFTNLEDYLNDLEAIQKTHQMITESYQEPCFITTPQVSHVDNTRAQILWVSPEGTEAGQVHLETLSGGQAQIQAATLSAPGFQNRERINLAYVQQRVNFESLEASAGYRYEVQCGDGTTTHSGTFRTAPETGHETPVHFTVVSDGHSTGGMYGTIAEAVAAQEPDFVVHAGGMIGGQGDDWDKWVHYFRVAQPFLENSVIWPVAGKNDARPDRNFHGLFGFNNTEIQDPAPDDHSPTWYRFSYGKLEYFVFDFSRDLSPQLEWADQVMAESQARWKIVSYHYPEPGVGGRGRVFELHYDAFFRLFEEHGVDVVVYGGNHIYERFLPVGPVGMNPVHYVSINSGSSFRETRPSPVLTGGIGAKERMLLHFRIEGNLLEMEALRDDGTVIDRLELMKGLDGLYQPEVMNQTIDIDLARTLAHIFTEQSVTEDLRNDRRDICGEHATVPPVAGLSTRVWLHTGRAGSSIRDISRFPIGSELVIHEQTDPSGWRMEEQIIEITGDQAEVTVIAPENMSLVSGRTDPALELRAHLRMNGRDFEPVTLWPTIRDFENLDQPRLIQPSQLMTVPLQPGLVWETISHTLEYQLQIGEGNFANIVVDTTVAGNEMWLPFELKSDQTYRWRVRGINTFGEGPWSADRVFKTQQVVSAETEEGIPREFALNHNYPNPFNPTTTIRYSLPVDAMVTLRVYDVIGREVARLVQTEQQAGHHQVPFEALFLASGIYQYRLVAVPITGGSEHERFVQTRSMSLIK